MSAIDIVVPRNGARRWHAEIIARLEAGGHDIRVLDGAPERTDHLLNAVLSFEHLLFRLAKPGLADRAALAAKPSARKPDLILDLTGTVESLPAPALRLTFDSGPTLPALAGAIAAGNLPDIHVRLDGELVAEAHPMIDVRVSIARGLEDVLARAVSLAVATVERALRGGCTGVTSPSPAATAERPFAPAYLTAALPRLAREFLRRRKFHSAHWRVGYRLIDGDGVAQTGDLSGTPWSVLPDDGTHFYADPFPFAWQGWHYLFVEDLPHATGKAVISVSRLDDRGVAGPPVPVLEEPYHLSYPQVFARDGEVWMLPEASASGELVLYRAENFPDRWVRHAVLIAGRAISDATLLQHDGALWLFATDRDGAGSTSDMLVIYRADVIEGPWVPHPANPIRIDRRSARPGGAFVVDDGKILLPVQDGTMGYGGGLGFAELRALDSTNVDLAAPKPIAEEGYWPYPQIHTLNRMGRLEVIDGIAESRK
jgi:hypothetical protein